MNATYKNILEELSRTNTKLVAVSKTKPNELIMDLYDQGQRDFGENRVQELKDKYEALPKDINWHLIGHLQKNKVKYVAEFVSMIHSIDSLDLLEMVNKQAIKHERKIDVLLQIKIAQEESKYGFNIEDLEATFDPKLYENITFRGVMGMATFTENEEIIRSEFRKLVLAKTKMEEKFENENSVFTEISMGMSGDYKIACEEGSTIVRVGSLLFGNR